MNATSKLVKAWESKNAKNAARAGGVSLMALSLAACGGSDDAAVVVPVDITSDNEDFLLAAVTAVDATATTVTEVAANATAAGEAAAEAAISQSIVDAGITIADDATGAETIAAIAASDNTEVMMSQADYDAANAAAALSDNTEVMMSQADYDAANAAAALSDNTEVMMSQADYDAAIDAADDAEQATIDATNTAVTGAGFADVDALIAAYTDLIDGSPLDYTPSATADELIGTIGNDTITAELGTYVNGDSLRDVSTTDNDTVDITHNAAVTPNISDVENVNLNLNATGAADVTASSLTGVSVLTVTRGDVTVGGSVIAGDTTVVVDAVDSADVGTIVAGAGTTTVAVNQTTTAGITVNADAASGNVTVDGAATVNAAGAGTGDTVQLEALDNADAGSAALATAANALAVNVNTGAATVNVLTSTGGDTNLFTGAVDITADAATTVLVENAVGGLTLSATADDAQITVSNIDASGATITVGTGVATAGNSDIDLALDGTTALTDTVTVAGAGAIDLDVNTAQLIDIVNLSGTTAAVDYNMVTSVPTTINLTGAQSVTVSQTADGLDGLTLTNGLTAGSATVAINTIAGAAVDASLVAADNFILEVDAGLQTGSELTLLSGSTVTVAADQTDLDLVGSAAGGTVSIVTADDTAANGTAILLELDAIIASSNLTTVNIDATAGAFDADSITLAAAGDLNLTGTQNIDLGVTTASSVTSTTTGVVTLDTAAGATTLNSITTGNGADQLTLDVAAVVMNMSSGAGNDVISANNAAASQYDLGDGNDQITLGAGATAVVVVGGDGNDTLITAADTDAIFSGGDGNDTFNLTADADLSDNANFALASVEAITLATGVDLTLSAAQYNANATFTATGVNGGAAETLTIAGSANADNVSAATITATDVSITLTGLAGDDILTGGTGDDTIIGGIGADAISGGTGSDTVSYTGAANTTETGTQVGVVVNLGATAATATSVLNLTGDFVADSVNSVASNTATYLYAGAGATNSATTDSLNSIENVVGTDGTDYIIGSAVANTITGGAGADTLTGGLGADTFVFAATASLLTVASADTVTDFVTGTDILDLVMTGGAGAADAVIADGAGLANLTAVVAAADAVFTALGGNNDDAVVYYNVSGGGDAYVLVDVDDSGTFDAGDTLTILTGIDLVGEIALTDLI